MHVSYSAQHPSWYSLLERLLAAQLGGAASRPRRGHNIPWCVPPTMTTSTLRFAVLYALSEPMHANVGCETDLDCSLNGRCTVAGLCECKPAWRGRQCSTLNLLPARLGAGLNTSDAGGPLSSWGGTVNLGDDGKYQMRRSKQELWIAHKDKVHHTSYTVATKDLLHDVHEDDWQYWKSRAIDLEEQNQKLKSQISDLNVFKESIK